MLKREVLERLLYFDISIEGPALDNFIPDEAIDSWWKTCSTGRHANQ